MKLIVQGVGRVDNNDRVILVSLSRCPTDDELRELHDYLRKNSDRKYSVSEIDEMRMTIRNHWFYGRGSYKPHERGIEVEEILRTYMIAGVSPDELGEEGERKRIVWYKED
jgi:hypothetical protein